VKPAGEKGYRQKNKKGENNHNYRGYREKNKKRKKYN
jgi:hypothetical protein